MRSLCIRLVALCLCLTLPQAVSAGEHIVRDVIAGGGDVDLYDMQLTLLYIPTSCGTVSPTVAVGGSVPEDRAPVRTSASRYDIESERAGSDAADRKRIEWELEAMR